MVLCKDKVPNEWKDFTFAIEYIAKHRLLNLNEKRKYNYSKISSRRLLVSFEKELPTHIKVQAYFKINI